MAARRLIIVLLVLFGISVVAAAIAPDRKGGGLFDRSGSDSTTTTTTTPTIPAPPPDTSEAVTARIDASVSRPQTVEGFVDDQLQLNVGSDRARVIEIADFGVTEVAASDAPANFNLLLRDAGVFVITDIDTGKIVGRLVVREPGDETGGGGTGRQGNRGEAA